MIFLDEIQAAPDVFAKLRYFYKEMPESISAVIDSSSFQESEIVKESILRTYEDDFYKKPELYYWVRETKSSSAEIDYVISHGSDIIPIEVKAGKTVRLKSLHQFIKEKNSKLAIRINTDLPTLLHEKNKVAGGDSIDYELLSIPFYLTEQIRRLISEVLADG